MKKTIQEILAIEGMPVFQFAYKQAQEAHAGHFRKDGVTPYMVHIDGVIVNIYELCFQLLDERKDKMFCDIFYLQYFLAVGSLHDWKEDRIHVISLKEMENRFYGEFVDDKFTSFEGLLINAMFFAIDNITKKSKGEESYTEYLTRVRSMIWSHIAKIADLMHNMSDLPAGNLRDKYDLTLTYLQEKL